MSDVEPLQPTARVEIIATGLRSIYEDRGRLSAEEVVEIATPADHPLHDLFVWDDTEAAHRYRVWQAGQMIRSVKILVSGVQDDELDEFKIREWIPARRVGLGKGFYLPEEEVRGNPTARKRLLRQMQRDIDAVARRYRHLNEFWQAVEQLAEQTPETAGEAGQGPAG
jgi:hypothetical protein